jgi:hypothetical protein
MPRIPTFQEDMVSIGRDKLEKGVFEDTSLLSGCADGPPRISSTEKVMRPCAVKWLYAHEELLIARGWEQAELYGAKGVFGIGWSQLWENEDVVVKMEDTGCVSWSSVNGRGKEVVFYTWPNCVKIPFKEFDKF